MTTTANLKPANGAGIDGLEAAEISPEDAERYAAAFRPMWELDDAPFAPTAPNLSAQEVRELSAGGVNGDVVAALKTTQPLSARPAPKKAAVATAVPQPRARVASRNTSSLEIDMRSVRRSNKALYLVIG